MDQLTEFRLILLGILIEAVPFIVLAAFLSFLFELFVPENFFPRLFGGRVITGILIAAAAGFAIPICECCIVPIARKLAKRGVPLPVAVTFMVAVPSLNPIVMAGTSAAFITNPQLIYLRAAAGFSLAVAAGLVFFFYDRLRNLSADPFPADSTRHCACGANHSGSEVSSRLRPGLDEAASDFIRMLGFMVMAALITALIQVFVSDSIMNYLAARHTLGAPAMMLFAFVTSTCSDADAFIAAAMNQFGPIPKLAFLLLGPVLDIKQVLMHFALLPRRAAILLLVSFPLLVAVALVFIDFLF